MNMRLQKKLASKTKQAYMGFSRPCLDGHCNRCKSRSCGCECHDNKHKVAEPPLISTKTPKIRKGCLSWSHNTRVEMYKSLVKAFGPYKKWKSIAAPDFGRTKLNKLYRFWKKEYADKLCLEQGIENIDKSGALEAQIAWSFTKQDPKDLNKQQHQVMLANKTAALEAGFLG